MATSPHDFFWPLNSPTLLRSSSFRGLPPFLGRSVESFEAGSTESAELVLSGESGRPIGSDCSVCRRSSCSVISICRSKTPATEAAIAFHSSNGPCEGSPRAILSSNHATSAASALPIHDWNFEGVFGGWTSKNSRTTATVCSQAASDWASNRWCICRMQAQLSSSQQLEKCCNTSFL